MRPLDRKSLIRHLLPGYQLGQQIYESINSIVYHATRKQDNQPVILKILKLEHPQLEELTRYKQEYEIISCLDAEGIIKAYGMESDRFSVVLILEDFGGVSLNHWLKEWKNAGTNDFPLLLFLKLSVQIVAGLAHIHSAGIIHKNINPSNIVFNSHTGELKLIDFGFAAILSKEIPVLKSPQVFEGTLVYMSPEQTGRMNRIIDYRTDFYSLGVTFYELLTGKLPFKSDDPLTLMHAHIAKIPKPVTALNPSIPPIISNIVMKLLSKNAEDRYQSAFGLKSDLERCQSILTGLQDKENLEDIYFELGQNDYSGHLHIQQKLYGRTTEIEMLLKAFDYVVTGNQELMLVAGYSGVGKSALIAELYKPVTEKCGYFIKGKFDQYQQNTPYTAFTHAFNQLVELLLTELESNLEQWRHKILTAVSSNGAVLTEVIPGLGNIIGPQPAVPKLSGYENRNRFNLTFLNFIQAISTAEHPLAVFIDDWQWADMASLELLKVLFTSAKIPYVLLIGAYRDNEVDKTHPFIMTLNELTAAGTKIQIIELGNLQQTDVHQLIQESLFVSPDDSRTLTELVYAKTQGNAFFIRQFLQNLYEENWLKFDFITHRWAWDINLISTLQITDNVIDLMVVKLKKLAPETVNLLQLAACIGNEFDLRTLALIGQMDERTTLDGLMKALTQGIVIPLNEYYKLSDTAAQSHFRFLHDRVQQAAYSLIPEFQKQSTHLHIAKLLLNNTVELETSERIFEIVNHFNQSLDLLIEKNERQKAAQLNLIAGQKAREAAAFKTSWDYFTISRSLISNDSWKENYAFTLELYDSSIEAAYLSGEFEAMEELFKIVLQEAQTSLDTIKVHEVRIQALTAQTKFLEAVDLGLQVIRSIGIEFPFDPGKEDINKALQETQSIYQDNNIQELISLPIMTNPVNLAAMRIFSSILSTSFLLSVELHTMIVLKQVGLSIKYGNAPASAFAYASYGIVLCGRLGEIEPGYQFSQLALDLMKRFNIKEWQCKVPSVVHTFITHWKQSVRDTLVPLRTAYYSGMENGDFQFAGYSAFLSVSFAYYAGLDRELSILQQETESLSQSIYQMKQMTIFQYFKILQQALHDLKEGRSPSEYLQGEYYDEETMMQNHVQAKDWIGIYYVNFHKLIFNYLFRNYKQAIVNASNMELYLNNASSFPYSPIFYLYDSLSRLALYRETPIDEPDDLLLRIKSNQKKLKTWAHFAPMNCLYKVELIEAELLRTFGEKVKALEAYDRAILEAKKNGYWREEALANELTASFFLDWGKEKIAQIYIQEAYECYKRWQARAKLRDLEKRYPIWFEKSTQITYTERNNVHAEERNGLDLKSVMKASQIISGRIVLEELLRNLMQIVIENAGAQQGCLILEKNGTWVIEAEVTADQKEVMMLQAIKIEKSDIVCPSIIRYVARSHESIVLDDAARIGPFIDDPYVKQNQTKSILCIPLLNRGILSGILYMENNLSTNTFTPDRIEVLELLAGQAAIALENAYLYKKAQQEIEERKQIESALSESEKRFRTIFDSVNDAIFVHDSTTGAILDVNQKMCKMYGYTHEEALQVKIEDLSLGKSPYTQEDALVWIQKTINEGPQLFEWYAKNKDGHLFWVEVNMRLATIDSQDRIILVVRDIMERKQAEEILENRIVALTRPLENAEGIEFEELFNISDIQHLQDLYANAFGVAALITRPDGTPITQPSNFTYFCGKIVRMTSKGSKNCNYSDSMLGKHNPTGPNIGVCLSAGLCNAGASITVGGRHIANWLIGQVRNENQDAEKIKKYAREIGVDEDLFYSEYLKIPVMSQEQFEKVANVLFVLANQLSTVAYQNVQQARFIAERKRAEEALQAKTEELDRYFTSSLDLLCIADTDGYFHRLNPEWEKTLGYSITDLEGKQFFEFVHPDDIEATVAAVSQLKTQKQVLNFENRYRCKDGSYRWIEWRSFPKGKMIYAVARDITERKQAESDKEKLIVELEAKNAELEQFSYTVSHDLKSPLVTVRGFLGLLEKDAINGDMEQFRKDMQHIFKATDTMQQLLKDLLELSRVGRSKNFSQELAFEDLVKEAQELIAGLITEHGVKITIASTLPGIYGDRFRLVEMLQNLMENAIKFMGDQPKPEITINAKQMKNEVIFSITDNGIGINPRYHKKIFGLFERLDTNTDGTGIGLTLVKRIIDIHGGRIWVESEGIAGRGSTFYFTLPLKQGGIT